MGIQIKPSHLIHYMTMDESYEVKCMGPVPHPIGNPDPDGKSYQGPEYSFSFYKDKVTCEECLKKMKPDLLAFKEWL